MAGFVLRLTQIASSTVNNIVPAFTSGGPHTSNVRSHAEAGRKPAVDLATSLVATWNLNRPATHGGTVEFDALHDCTFEVGLLHDTAVSLDDGAAPLDGQATATADLENVRCRHALGARAGDQHRNDQADA